MANKKLIDTIVAPSLIRGNWRISTRSAGTGLYALAVVPAEGQLRRSAYLSSLGAIRTMFPGQDPEALEYVFNVNPSAISTDEPAAVQIVPTQDGSQFVEHQGNIYKNITISGTTGLRPSKTPATTIPILNVPNPFSQLFPPDVDPITRLPPKERTGFEDIILLRNLFRAYFDIKRDIKEAHRWVMVWQNGKEGEWLIVEPTTLRVSRDASSPLTARYEIQLRSIKRFDLLAVFKDKKLDLNFTSLVKKFTDFQTKIARTLAAIGAVQDRMAALDKITAGILTSTISLAEDVYRALTLVQTTRSVPFPVTRSTVESLAKSAKEVFGALQGDALSTYRSNPTGSQATTAWGAFKEISRIAAAIAAEDSIFGEKIGRKFDRRRRAFSQDIIGPPLSGGSPTNLNNTTVPAGSQLATVTSFDTIFTISQRYLSDQARWKEIVILNDLKAPYIASTGDGKTVLRPGDQILVPSLGGELESGVAPDRTDTTDRLVQRLGRDLKLRKDSFSSGITQFDLGVGATGDLALIEGIPNLVQAVEIKFATEKGSLPTHPTFGLQIPIGTKANIRSLIGFHMDTRGSLLSDSRIGRINQLNFRIEGNVLLVRADLQIVDVDETVTVSFDARR